MGKDSLIKSTDKKASGTKKEAGKTKQKATKKTEAKPQKTAAKKPAPKKIASKKTPARPKAKAKPAVKAVAIKDLILKKFEPLQPPVVAEPPPEPEKLPDAPPLISTSDAKEAERLRKLLFSKFSMEEVKAAAKPPRQPAPSGAKPVSKPAAQQKKAPAAEPGAEDAAKPAPEAADEIKPALSSACDHVIEEGPDPMKKVIKYAVAGFLVVLLLIIGTSVKNSAKYYLKTTNEAIEIWRGNFSPTGKSLVITLPGVQAPDEQKTIYSREEVFPLAFNYYLGKADDLLDKPGQPDYEKIKIFVHQASAFAVNSQMKQAVQTRLNTIDRLPLLFKAEVALSKGTAESLDAAMGYLKKAKQLTSDPAQLEIINQKIEAAKEAKAALSAQTPEQQ